MSLSKWLSGSHFGFFGFHSLTLVWLWISTPDFSTLLVYLGRSIFFFLVMSLSKWSPCGHIGFWSFSIRRYGFQSVSQVCFKISISDFMRMLFVVIGRSLLISTFKVWAGLGCEVSCGGQGHEVKTTMGSALDGAVFDFTQILVYLIHNMNRSQLYLGLGHFDWLLLFSQ